MTGQPDEVGRFAEHLRDLKDRTGHSFGVLAGRLHIGRSTLHRYCLGETTPSDYAVVDRLARLAGASREELIELHRRWVLADEARVRAAPPRPPAAEASGARTADGAPESAPSGPRVPNAGPGAEAPASRVSATQPGPSEITPETDREIGPRDPNAVREASRQADPMAARHTGPESPDAPPQQSTARPRRPETESSATGDPGGTIGGHPAGPPPGPTEDGPTSSAASTHAPRHRRRRILAVSAAAVLAVGSAVMTNSLSGRDSSGTDDRSANRPRPSSAPAVPHTAGPSVSTDAHLWHHDCAHRYLVDRDSSAVPPPPVPQDAAAWSQPLDAVDGDRTTVRATISAPDDGSVVVQRLAVRVVNRRPALDWPAYAMNPGCGGSLTPARYTVDLDVPRPLAQPESGGAVNHTGEARTLPAPRLPFQVTQGDPLVLRVEATAVHCDCDWYLEAEWTRGDQHGTLRIDDAGRPFRTSGKGAGKQYYYATEGSGWTAYSSPPRTSTL